jgi:CHAD domain-containing protein
LKKDQKTAIELPTGAELSQRLSSCLSERLETLLDLKKQVVNRIDAVAIHDLRVASRRLRTVIEQLEPFIGEHGVDDMRRPVRRLTRGLGQLRNLDESLLFFKGLGVSGLEPLVEQLALERQMEAEKVSKGLKAVDKDRLRQQCAKAIKRINSASASDLRGMIALLSEQNLRLFRPIHSAQTLVRNKENEEDRHGMRIAVKKWRYFTELLEQLFNNDMSDLLDNLKGYQSVLGGMNDRAGFLALLNDAEQLSASGRAEAEARITLQQKQLLEQFIGLLDNQPLKYVFRI